MTPNIIRFDGQLSQSSNCFRAAIVSDLHAYDPSFDPGPSTPSFLQIGAAENNPSEHPIAGLLQLIQEESLTVDVLFCPGDLGDRCRPAATKHAWSQVKSIASALSARHVIATAGNHDIDSRFSYNSYDAKGFLQALQPIFPFDHELAFDRYWSRHFVVLSWKDVRVVILNSSAYHGAAAKNDVPEYEHGRVATSTLEAIKESLKSEPTNRLNILLCHHHPQPQEEFGLGHSDVMANGAELLRILSDGSSGEWMIIHGHKHFPKLTYAQGATSVTPIVLAAGSLCARLPAEIQSVARNQFYSIEFPLRSEHGLVGCFRAWDWNFGLGWQPAQKSSGLPRQGGFGIRAKPDVIANLIKSECAAARQTSWDDLQAKIPMLRYLVPNDIRIVRERMEASREYRFVFDKNDLIIQVERLL